MRTPLLLSSFLLAAAAASAQPAFTVVDLGTLGGARSVAFGLNAQQHVVGASTTADGTTHAFVYLDGALRDLGTVGQGATSMAKAINDSDVIAGWSARDAGAAHAVVWRAGTVTDLGALAPAPFDASYATAIGASGDVTGTATVNRYGRPVTHGFLYSGGTMRDLGTPAGSTAEPTFAPRAINAADQIVGSAANADGLGDGIAVFTQGTLSAVALPAQFAATSITATGINATGAIAGFYVAGDHARSFVAVNGAVSDLGALDGYADLQANALNAASDVVGRATDLRSGASTAFLYHDGRLYDLTQLVAAGSTAFQALNEATAVNDRGDITGFGITATGETHAFLLLQTGADGLAAAYIAGRPVVD